MKVLSHKIINTAAYPVNRNYYEFVNNVTQPGQEVAERLSPE